MKCLRPRGWKGGSTGTGKQAIRPPKSTFVTATPHYLPVLSLPALSWVHHHVPGISQSGICGPPQLAEPPDFGAAKCFAGAWRHLVEKLGNARDPHYMFRLHECFIWGAKRALFCLACLCLNGVTLKKFMLLFCF